MSAPFFREENEWLSQKFKALFKGSQSRWALILLGLVIFFMGFCTGAYGAEVNERIAEKENTRLVLCVRLGGELYVAYGELRCR